MQLQITGSLVGTIEVTKPTTYYEQHKQCITDIDSTSGTIRGVNLQVNFATEAVE